MFFRLLHSGRLDVFGIICLIICSNPYLPILERFRLGPRDVMGFTIIVFLGITPVVLLLVFTYFAFLSLHAVPLHAPA